MARDQSFVARYNFPPPWVMKEQNRLYLVEGEKRHSIGSDEYDSNRRVAELLEQAGHVVERVPKVQNSYELPDGFYERAQAAIASARNAKGPEPLDFNQGDDEGEVSLSAHDGLLTVRTPTRLGQAVHKARRRPIEQWLRAERLDWTLTCATEHSDIACKPIPPTELAVELSG